jgi:hypothetical protein
MPRQIHTIALALAILLNPVGKTEGADRFLDGEPTDWCFGLPYSDRIENSAVRLSCGSCEGAFEPTACLRDDDCAAGQVCSGAHDEIVWYDARTDSAVNDLRTVASAQDEFVLYFVIDWHAFLDPVALPNLQIALDFQPGGTHELVDPRGTMLAPGVCSDSIDRACTKDEDCHFCTRSFELPACCNDGSCEGDELCRVQICGSGCNPDDPLDFCDMSQTCEDLGATALARVGLGSSPLTQADYLVTYDVGRMLVGVSDALQLSRWTGTWSPLGTFEVVSQSLGIPERPPSVVLEAAIPWVAFGCTNWTEQDGCGAGATATSCGCPDFGPGTPFNFAFVVSRAELTLDFSPWGAIEDVGSEAVAGTTTVTTNSCPGEGIGTTRCEIANGSTDSFAPELVLEPGGTVPGLRIVRKGVGDNPSITLRWNPSCSFGDTDYEIYQGSLAALSAYEHEPVLCSTAGATTVSFSTDPGDRYYLVVPTDGMEEGSYGVDGTGAQRPGAPASCRSQVTALACP